MRLRINAIRCRLLFIGLALALWFTPVLANEVPQKLIVGTLRSPPFVTRADNGQWGGLSIDLMQRVAAELGAKLEFRDYAYDDQALLAAVTQNQIDAAIGTIPLNPEDEARFDFSHPYFNSGVGIVVKNASDSSILSRLAQGIPRSFLLGALAVFVLFLLLVGTLMWLVERRDNAAQFARHPLPGISDGIWWAIVTMTFTGYGDKIPSSSLGRSVAMLWMFVSLCLLALFSSTLASTLTLSSLTPHINSPEDLPSSRIAAVTGSPAEAWLMAEDMPIVRHYPSVIQASKALQKGEVEVLLHDKAILSHMVKLYGWTDLTVLPHTVAVYGYGIALPTSSVNREAINHALLKVLAKPEWKASVERTIGKAN